MPKLPFTKLFMLVMLFKNITILPASYAGTPIMATEGPSLLLFMLEKQIVIENLEIDIQAQLKAEMPIFLPLILHLAVAIGNLDNVVWLLKNGADKYINKTVTSVYCENDSNCGYKQVTPLHVARKPNIVQLLIDNGADLTKKCKDFYIRKDPDNYINKKDLTPLQTLYFCKETNYINMSNKLKTLDDEIAIDQCIAILEDAEITARMSPEKIAWLSAVYQTSELLG